MESVQRQGTEPIGKLLFQYSLPAVAGFLANALYQFVDRVLVGRGVGTEAMAAVTCVYPLTILTMGVGLLLGTGCGNQISTLLGRGDRDGAERVLGQSLRLAAIIGGALALALVVLARPVLGLCGAGGAVLEMAIPYLRVTALGQVFLIAVISMGSILRVQGRPMLGLAFMATGNVLNVLLAWIAIYLLHWGTTGAAIATTATLALNFAALLAFVQSRGSIVRVRRAHLASDRAVARSILALGAPVLVMQVLGMLVMLAANHGAARLDGARGVAVVGVFNTIALLLVFPMLGVVQAMQPLVAYNRGAGLVARVRSLLLGTLATTLTMGFVFSALVLLSPGALASLFTRTDAPLVALVSRGLPWYMLSVAFFGIGGTASHYYLAIHEPRKASLFLTGRQFLAIPLFLILPRIWGFEGLYLVAPISDLPMAVLAAWSLRGEWKRLAAAEATATASASGSSPGGVAASAKDGEERLAPGGA